MVTENKIVCYYSDDELREILKQREDKAREARAKDLVNSGYTLHKTNGIEVAYKFRLNDSGVLNSGARILYDKNGWEYGSVDIAKI